MFGVKTVFISREFYDKKLHTSDWKKCLIKESVTHIIFICRIDRAKDSNLKYYLWHTFVQDSEIFIPKLILYMLL